jgi:hypothetical protein
MAKNYPLLFKQMFIITSCSIFISLTFQYSVGTSKPFSYFNPSCNHSKTFSPVSSPALYRVKNLHLKVLSIEMDPVEIRLILFVVIKETGKKVFWKNLPSPHAPLRAMKSIRAPPCFLIAN